MTEGTIYMVRTRVGGKYPWHRQRCLILLRPSVKGGNTGATFRLPIAEHDTDGHFSWISVAKHRIVLNPPDVPPIHSVPHRACLKQRKLEREKVDSMQEAGVAESAVAEWASSVVFVLKKDRILRFCADFRGLNAVAVRESYLILRMDECTDSLCEAQSFTTLDANLVYWQFEMGDNDIDKTAFVTNHGLFKYFQMPFGLKNAPATSQWATDIILASVKWQHALVYIENVIIFRSWQNSTCNTQKKGYACSKMHAKQSNWRNAFFQQKNRLLGHMIASGKLDVAQNSTEEVSSVQ